MNHNPFRHYLGDFVLVYFKNVEFHSLGRIQH